VWDAGKSVGKKRGGSAGASPPFTHGANVPRPAHQHNARKNIEFIFQLYFSLYKIIFFFLKIFFHYIFKCTNVIFLTYLMFSIQFINATNHIGQCHLVYNTK